jgi:hypothetical protein
VFAKRSRKNYVLNKIRQGFIDYSYLILLKLKLLIAFTSIEKKLVGFEVVQLVNEYPLPTIFFEKKMLDYIFKTIKEYSYPPVAMTL